jgi:hypothetical protein
MVEKGKIVGSIATITNFTPSTADLILESRSSTNIIINMVINMDII